MSIFDTTFATCKPQFTTNFSLAGVLGWKEIFCFVRCSVFSPCLSIAPSLIFLLNLATFVVSKDCKIDQDKNTNHCSFLAKYDPLVCFNHNNLHLIIQKSCQNFICWLVIPTMNIINVFFFATPLKTQFPVSGLLLSSIQRFWCLSTRFFRSFLCQIVRRNIWESIMLLFDPIFPNCKPQFITRFYFAGVLGWKDILFCAVFGFQSMPLDCSFSDLSSQPCKIFSFKRSTNSFEMGPWGEWGPELHTPF